MVTDRHPAWPGRGIRRRFSLTMSQHSDTARIGRPEDLHIDIRWLLDRQEELLGKELGARDYSGPVAVSGADHFVLQPQH